VYRHSELDSTENGGQTSEVKRGYPQIDTGALRLNAVRRISSPTRIRHAKERAEQQDNTRRGIQPVTQGIHSWKRHVARANHQRYQVVTKRAGQQWNDDGKNHDGCVHGEEFVIRLRET